METRTVQVLFRLQQFQILSIFFKDPVQEQLGHLPKEGNETLMQWRLHAPDSTQGMEHLHTTDNEQQWC